MGDLKRMGRELKCPIWYESPNQSSLLTLSLLPFLLLIHFAFSFLKQLEFAKSSGFNHPESSFLLAIHYTPFNFLSSSFQQCVSQSCIAFTLNLHVLLSKFIFALLTIGTPNTQKGKDCTFSRKHCTLLCFDIIKIMLLRKTM